MDEFRLHQYRLARIPPDFKDAVAPDTGEGLYLWGPPGTGKTYTACGILNAHLAASAGELILDGDEIVACLGMFCEVSELLDSIRESYREGSTGESEMLRRAKCINLLVLDDLGGEKVTDWVREKIFQVVNARYNSKLRTIVTSNLDPEQLKDHIGDRIVSRLMEMCRVVPFKGEDRRLRE